MANTHANQSVNIIASATSPSSSAHPTSSMISLTLAAIGIVYGDIGTSPLYAFKEVFSPSHGVAITPDNVMGVISLMLWTLMIIVTLKYVTLILRADNHGEGGVMALTALALSSVPRGSWQSLSIIGLGLFGAALFYGDGAITPAISVLSAIEGLESITPAFKPYVIPITLVILTLLYMMQKRGTESIGFLFGPVTLIWFAVLALLGVYHILQMPYILMAFNPLYAINFFMNNHLIAFFALGAIVLCVTGAEALYADLGHFGQKPIQYAWLFLVLPALALNYLGQGALVLRDPSAIENPFYGLIPDWGLLPMVVLATMATVIASQATISGTFSLTRQAIQLGYLPRMDILHTSASSVGQIYMPSVNWAQYCMVVMVVLGFKTSSNMASAYGIAVTGTMLITTILTFFVIRHLWRMNIVLCILATLFFALIDVAFFAANATKFVDGGWMPILVGVIIFTLMLTWKEGRALVKEQVAHLAIPVESFVQSIACDSPVRVAGNAIFLRGDAEGVPRALLHNLYHNKILHDQVVFVTVHVAEIPFMPQDQRIKLTELGERFYQVDLYYGFKETPDIPQGLALCQPLGLVMQAMETSYFISKQSIIPTIGAGMATWREHLFVTMTRNATDPAEYYNLPRNRVVEMGAQITI
jgi:KUP system potassium uptake protein